MPQRRSAAGILVAICLSSFLAVAQEECLLVEVDFEGIVDATQDLGPLAELLEEGSRMRGSYQVNSCATPSGGQRTSASYMDAIDTDDFNMEIGRVRFWPSREAQIQLTIGNDVKNGPDSLDLWSVHTADAKADVDMEEAEIALFLNLSDDTHSVFDSKKLVTVPDLSRFDSNRFGVSKKVVTKGRTRNTMYIAGEITQLRYIRSR
ncbi:MAG: hypothetical protein VCE43_20830 [Myxococcota bacterium]